MQRYCGYRVLILFDKTAAHQAVILASSSGYLNTDRWYEAKDILRLTETCTILVTTLCDFREEALAVHYWNVVEVHTFIIFSRTIGELFETVNEYEYETTSESP